MLFLSLLCVTLVDFQMFNQPCIPEITQLVMGYNLFCMLLNLVSLEAVNLLATAEGFYRWVWGHAFITVYNSASAFTSCFHRALK